VSVLAASLAASAVGCDEVIRFGERVIQRPETDPDIHAQATRQRALDDMVAGLTHPEREPSGEVILRLSLTGGWGVPDAEDLHLTIEDDGRVIKVADTSVFSSTRDYTSLRLDETGIIRVLEVTRPLLPARREDLDGGAGVSPTDRSAWLEVGDAIVLSMDRIGQAEGYTPGQRAWRSLLGRSLDRIEDLTWLGDAIIEPESPWVPESMTVLAGSISPRSGLGPGTPFAPWPLDRSIDELADGTTLDAYGEEDLVLCLTGDQVAPVFALLTGVNRAHLRVDDGKEWELEVRPHYPGYRLAGDPCPPG
jgi:hypothetical protein